MQETVSLQTDGGNSLFPKFDRINTVSSTNHWEDMLKKALSLIETTLKLGIVTLSSEYCNTPCKNFTQAKLLLANALEHTTQPWLVLEVLALVHYYLGDPVKAKALAFNSLNQYETALQVAKTKQTALPTALQGYTFLTLGFIFKQQGAFPLALDWFNNVPQWQAFSPLLRLEGVWQVVACANSLKPYNKQPSPSFKLKTTKWYQLTQYFSIVEQWQLVRYCFQALHVGFSLAKQSTKKATPPSLTGADSTANFSVPQACLIEAQRCFAKGKTHWKQGVRILKRSLRNNPNEPLTWYELGLFYIEANHKTRAIQAFQHCTNLLPTCSKAQLELGHLYHDMGDYLASAQAYVWAISTTTNATIKRQAAYALSVILERHAEKPTIQAALASLSVILSLLLKQEQEAPFSTSGTPSHLAKLCQQLGWKSLAYWFCINSLAVNTTPQQPQCVVNLAYMAAENGFLQEAVYYYKQSILENETDASLYNSLGELYFEDLLLLDPAKKAFEQAIVLDPASATAQFNLGQVYGVQQQWTMAAQAFTKAMALNETSNELDKADLAYRIHQLYENL